MESAPNNANRTGGNGAAPPPSLRERLRTSWFPPAAVLGGLAALIAAALRPRPAPRPASSLTRSSSGAAGDASPRPAARLPREYALAAVLCGASSARPFRRSLSGVAVGAHDEVHALGDDEVRVLDAAGGVLRQWKVAETAECLAVGPGGRVCVGGAGRIDLYDQGGRRVGGFTVGEPASPPGLTAVKLFENEILVADATARLVRRFDADGRPLGLIGDKSKTGSFILPNRHLDIDVDAAGVVRATDTGRHQVTTWALDGTPVGRFGKFGMSDPGDFVGCCNPVNLAVTPDGKIVTAEKMVARVKVYEPDGRLLALIGPEHFDAMCTQIHLAVDSKGRILAADPVRREIKVFSPVVKAGVEEPGRG